ncbi:hypothetical protein OESDEN_20487 [Oesophagostomum dentatum]|uniref:Uncharacterized protein n=1 Tax=Oesophagostomum dentatum TaxID=61180 RepID=A0A0B1S3B4_OESDE|nr:hypothetical protein OESDEN_20487 [Oesophagostomum dentatum]
MINKKLGVNRFFDGGGRLLHSAICLDLARLIELDEKNAPTQDGDLQKMYDEAFSSMFAEGPGCFSWTDERKFYIKYVPCFHACPCGSEAMKAPFKPYREMCQKKNGEYEPCTARRDVRKLLLREYDQKTEPLPEAHARGLYLPLLLSVISAFVCK